MASSPGERAKATLGLVLEEDYHSPGRQEGERTPDTGAAVHRHKGVEVCANRGQVRRLGREARCGL